MKKNIAFFIVGIILALVAIAMDSQNTLLRGGIVLISVIIIAYSLRHKVTRMVKKEVF